MRRSLVLICVLLGCRHCWAESPRLPSGLLLHLDASAQVNSGREVKNGMPLDHWQDSSAAGTVLSQADPARQPQLVRVGDSSKSASWIVRFDGQDDFLQVKELDQRLTNMTLFVVAAPHSNVGNFRGLLSFSQNERRDYETGFNIDMSWGASTSLNCINMEGPGFGGARDLLSSDFSFGTLHTFEATVDAVAGEVRLSVDGNAEGQRPFQARTLIADVLTVGARYYFNGPGPPREQGFFDGDIAEVLLFDRVLSDAERENVGNYLNRKHESLQKQLPREILGDAENIEILQTVSDPPAVQMLVPGFSVRELPVQLTNINNLRYRDDGKLYALGYNGEIWLLDDANGDGLEDSKKLFFDGKNLFRGPIGMAVIPAGHALLAGASGRAGGVVIASKGKVSAIIDADGDDIAEAERIIASGWKEIPQNVDAVGVAIHPDGSIFFGLGTANYANGYLLGEAGKSQFDLLSDHGTIQRIAADLSGRETVCTGVRFTIGMAIDADGELFVTDQEGATWLANGNPFDELLHIRPGLHYGFPPRHPRHLPNVFDQPSLFDYGPQHQSTCGMALNLPVQAGGPIFGPEHWRGDALVTGESRGKLYRTKLIKTSDDAYIAQNQLIACLGMLTVDCCLSPRGDLLVACHSGGPDWGTGPTGIGKIFAIRYQHKELPQPISVVVAAPQEIHVGFDRPLDPEQLAGLMQHSKITYGRYVAAGDRFESIRPGYEVTQRQMTTPRYRLPIHSHGITADRQTLILSTDRHDAAVNHAIEFPGLGRQRVETQEAELPQHAAIDLAYAPTGVLADWKPDNEMTSPWSGWLPHLDLDLAGKLSANAKQLISKLHEPGTLTLRTQLDVGGLFKPAVQPGSKLDYKPTDDHWLTSMGVVLTCSDDSNIKYGIAGMGERLVGNQMNIPVIAGDPSDFISIVWTIKTRGENLITRIHWSVTSKDGDEHAGPINPQRFWLPWVKRNPEKETNIRSVNEQLLNASWGRGRRVYFSDEAGCAKCHLPDADGYTIGPDLKNLVHRDYQSVLRDITQPSFAINPDFITYVVSLVDGNVLTGAVRSDGDQWLIADQKGKVTRVPRSEVEQMLPSLKSIMPDGIPKLLGPQKTNDLLAYLLLPPPRMPEDSVLPPPPPRSKQELAAILQGSVETKAARPINVLLVAGKKDHGPGEHDYPAWLTMWRELMLAAEGVTVDTAMEWPTNEQIERADTILFFQKGSWNQQRADAIDAHLARGGGLIYIHWAVEAGPQAPEFAKRIGLASEAAKLRFRHGPLELGFQGADGHPISRNFEQVKFYDESYWQMQGDRSRIRVIATGEEDGQPRPLFWTIEPKRGRVFVSILGHYSWTFDDPLFRVLLLRGTAWTAKQPIDRFHELATLGVELAND